MTAEVLYEAAEAVEDREQKYGPCEEHFARTAALVSAFLGVTVTARQWALIMALDKIARSVATPDYRDNYVDIAGYADRAHRCALAEVARGVSYTRYDWVAGRPIPVVASTFVRGSRTGEQCGHDHGSEGEDCRLCREGSER